MLRIRCWSVFPSWQAERRGGAGGTRLRLVQPARPAELAKGHENQCFLCHTGDDRERRDRTSSGEVEADKLAGPAHALLSE